MTIHLLGRAALLAFVAATAVGCASYRVDSNVDSKAAMR